MVDACAKHGATKTAAKISDKMRSAGELSEVSVGIVTFSSFMDGGRAKHGNFKKAEKAFENLNLENLVPGNFETFEAVVQALERRWGPPSSGKGRGAKPCP